MSLRRAVSAFGFGLSLLVATGVAHADTFAGTRFDLVERTDAIEVRLEHGHATLVVTRTVDNPGSRSDQAMFHLGLPDRAVATRLRTAGVGTNGQPIWFEGELMEAEAAAKKYRELTGIGGYYPKDPALLSWRSQRELALQVFPILAKSSKTVEYTLRMPMEYAEGAYVLHLSALGTAELPAHVRFTAADPEEAVLVNGVGVLTGTSVVASRELEVRLTPKASAPSLDGALASVAFAPDRVLVHARVAAAPHLGQIPNGAAVVVLIDSSISMRDELAGEIAAARAYLSHFPPSTTVEVMTFDRAVTSPFGGALPVRDAVARLSSFIGTTANGSHLDEALARADAKLALSPSPVRRILLFTDLRTREALTADRFGQRTLTSGALLHLAEFRSSGLELARDDESAWAKLPRVTGGLYWRAAYDGSNPAGARKVFEEWVRPLRIDKLKVTGLPSEFVAPPTLDEGVGLEHLQIANAPVAQVLLEGELWSKPVRWSTAPSAAEAKKWSGLVFGSHLIGELTEPEQMTLAVAGGAVSPVTSYLAIEPGVRPSTEGLEEGTGEGGGGQGFGIGLGGVGALGHGSLRSASVDREAFLQRELASAAQRCAVRPDHRLSAKVESTVDEIVEVRDVALTPTRDTKVETCVREQLWGVTLPDAFTGEHDTWSLVLQR